MFKEKDPEKEQAKQLAAAEKQAAKQTANEQKRLAEAEAAFRKTPRGQARTAREAGEGYFEYSGSLAETKRTTLGVLSGGSTASDHKRRVKSHTDVLSQIEDEGWILHHVGYVYEPTGSVSRDKMFSSGQTATLSGRVIGIYLFRVDEDWAAPAEQFGPEAEQIEAPATAAPPQLLEQTIRFDTQTGKPLLPNGPDSLASE